MPDLIAVAAYGKTQSLTDEECLELFNRLSRLKWEPSLERITYVIGDIKRERKPAPMPESKTHDEWIAERKVETDEDRHGRWIKDEQRYEDGCRADDRSHW